MPTTEQNDWIARVLEVRAGIAPGEDAPLDAATLGLGTVDLWKGAVAAYRLAAEEVDGQISQLQAALRETDDAELHEIAEFGLSGITGNTRVPLMAAIQEAGDGSGVRLKVAGPKLTKAIAAFRTHLTSEPRVAACDDNPFGIQVTILSVYEDALDEMEAVVRRAA